MSAQPNVNQTSVDQLRNHQVARVAEPADQTVDLFSARGFALAQRIAQAFSTSDAVPAQFRASVEKKSRNGSTWIDNPAAMGNCIVAIETARAVGMSITAVMQQANVIEGRLTWSGKFIIAAINASGRFTPLRFQVVNRGMIKATYREKQGWNDQKRGFDFKDVTVEVENLECVAWALPGNLAIPPAVRTLEQAKAANLPVIESAPVSMKMAVEEGWYGKSGSKWQTEMKHLMLQYRAGSFFGNIHAPDIVMGMGRTTEEVGDTVVIDVDAQGRVTSVSNEDLRTGTASTPAEEVNQKNTVGDAEQQQADDGPQQATAGTPAPGPTTAPAGPAVDLEAIADRLAAATSVDALDQLADQLLRPIADADARATLEGVYNTRREDLTNGAPAAATPTAPAASRRARAAAAPSME